MGHMSKRTTTQNVSTSENIPADHIGILIAALLMAVGGGLGLFVLISTSIPRLGAELWLFFILLHMTIIGVTIPIVRYFNVRLTSFPVPGGIIVRQSIWIGLYVVIGTWLQVLRVLSLPIGFFLALVFIVLEAFLRSRELSVEAELDDDDE